MSSRLGDFQRRYPSAIISPESPDSDATVGVKSYDVMTTKADTATYSFYHDELYQIQVVYFSGTIEKLGGLDAITDKLLETFGSANNVEKLKEGTIVTWLKPTTRRRAQFVVVPMGARLTVLDTVIESEVRKRRAQQTNTGF